MRIALEPLLLARSIPLSSQTDWLRAGGVLAALEASEVPFLEWHALDYEFHTLLYNNAQLPMMKKLVANLHSNLARYYRIYETLGSDFRKAGDAEHQAILAACKAQDTHTATTTLIDHLTRSSKHLLEMLTVELESNDNE